MFSCSKRTVIEGVFYRVSQNAKEKLAIAEMTVPIITSAQYLYISLNAQIIAQNCQNISSEVTILVSLLTQRHDPSSGGVA